MPYIPLKTLLTAAHEFVWFVLAMFGAYLALLAAWAMLARHR